MFYYTSSRAKRNVDKNDEDQEKKNQTKLKTTKIFVDSSSTFRYLKENDDVLIYIPEEMLIHGNVDPLLEGKIAKFIRFCDEDESDAEIMLKDGSIHIVPSFVLRLENKVLYSRMNKRKENRLITPKTPRKPQSISSKKCLFSNQVLNSQVLKT